VQNGYCPTSKDKLESFPFTHKATKYTETTAKAHKALGLLRCADATKNNDVIHIDYASKDTTRMMVKPATLDPYNAIFFDALRCMADGLPYLGPKIIGAIDDAKIDALLAEEITM
jgi:hypothetical protein